MAEHTKLYSNVEKDPSGKENKSTGRWICLQ